MAIGPLTLNTMVAMATNIRSIEFSGASGLTLRGDAYGEPNAPPVILLHGGGQTRHAWDETSRALAETGFEAIAIDMRGHGQSDWAPDGDYSLEAFVDDLKSVLNSLDARAAVVGASLGGITALLTEGESEEQLLAAIVLVDVAPRIELGGVAKILAFMTAHPNGFASLDEAADVVAKYLPHRPRPKDLSGLEKNLELGPDGRYRWHWDPAFITGSRRPGAVTSGDRLTDAARALDVPTLLVRGKISDLLSEEGAAHFLEAAPHAEYVNVAGAGHMVAGDSNDLFTTSVVDFLKRSLDR